MGANMLLDICDPCSQSLTLPHLLDVFAFRASLFFIPFFLTTTASNKVTLRSLSIPWTKYQLLFYRDIKKKPLTYEDLFNYATLKVMPRHELDKECKQDLDKYKRAQCVFDLKKDAPKDLGSRDWLIMGLYRIQSKNVDPNTFERVCSQLPLDKSSQLFALHYQMHHMVASKDQDGNEVPGEWQPFAGKWQVFLTLLMLILTTTRITRDGACLRISEMTIHETIVVHSGSHHVVHCF
jgi:hypothetical protein